MLRAIFADAVFCAALFVESLALLSILQAVAGLALPEAFTPMMNSYHAKTGLFSAFGASGFSSSLPVWYADAVLIAAVLFFLFFIAQARKAMAPYDDPGAGPLEEAKGIEAAIDYVLPVAVCAMGSAIAAPTLLPFLTLPVALWLLLKRLFGKPSWFKIAPSYYVNAALLTALATAMLTLVHG